MPESPNLGQNELGRTGLVRMDGVMYEEFLPKLRGIQGVRAYTEMAETSAVISATIYAIESLLRSVEWYVEPASESAQDEEAAVFLEQCLDDMSHTWEDFIAEVLSMLIYGWSYFEIVYKRRLGPSTDPSSRSRFDDGRIGWRKFAPRAQDTLWKWEIDANGGIQGMWQNLQTLDISETAIPRHVFLPISKCLLFRTTSRKNNPEGKSMLRGAYRAYYFEKRLEEIEAIGAERDLAGMPIAFVPPEVMAADRSTEAEATYRTIKDIVTRVKRDEQEGIIFPLAYDDEHNKLFDFQLLSTGGRRQFDVGSMIARYEQRIAMSLLADFILLGHEKVGSFALSSDKTELFAVSLGSILDNVEKVINRHAAPRLFELNTFNIPSDQLPEIRHGDIETPNLIELGNFMQAIAKAGIDLSEDFDVENFLRHSADMPLISPEDFRAKQEQRARAEQSITDNPSGFSSPPRPTDDEEDEPQ